jgi:hypothetical protein
MLAAQVHTEIDHNRRTVLGDLRRRAHDTCEHVNKSDIPHIPHDL